jgi:WD40 repeat protein
MDLARHAERDLLVAAGDDGRLSFWKLSSLTRLGEVSAHQGRALSVDLSPDGRLVASAGEDGLVTIWLASERRLLARLPHHRGAARSVRFAPDGRFVVSGGDDGSVRLWDLSLIEVLGDTLLRRVERLSQARLSGAKVELMDPEMAASAPRLP